MSPLIGGAGDLGWVAVKAVLLFAVAVVGLRLGERRTLAQLGAFDFAAAVAIGSIIGRTVTASDTSFLTGAVALVTLLAVHRLIALARRHSRIARAIDHPPRVLVARGAIQEREAARAGLTTADVYALLRRHDVEDLNQVGYLLYETRGATTLVGADREPGPLTREALSSAGFDHAIDKSSMITKDLCTYTIIILRQDKIFRDHHAAGRRSGPRSCSAGRWGRRVWWGSARPGWGRRVGRCAGPAPALKPRPGPAAVLGPVPARGYLP
jgi:uncharacterized membrane protein YcaP (DUF421 family)